MFSHKRSLTSGKSDIYHFLLLCFIIIFALVHDPPFILLWNLSGSAGRILLLLPIGGFRYRSVGGPWPRYFPVELFCRTCWSRADFQWRNGEVLAGQGGLSHGKFASLGRRNRLPVPGGSLVSSARRKWRRETFCPLLFFFFKSNLQLALLTLGHESFVRGAPFPW